MTAQSCSGCGRSRSEVEHLVELPSSLLICGSCAVSSVQAIAGHVARRRLDRADVSAPATRSMAQQIAVLGTDAPVPVSPIPHR